MNCLIHITNTHNFEPHHLKFFCLISEKGGIPPKSFFFDFEIRRLQFSYYATFKYFLFQIEHDQLTLIYRCINANRSKMILGMFVFFRIFLFKMILQPWLINPRLKRTDNKFV